MKKILLSLVCSLFFLFLANAQTWDGSESTNWNDPANWSTDVVPISTGSVIIPVTGSIPNWPVLANNVTVANFDMRAGSFIDFNGFTITASTSIDMRSATLNNSNGATDIVMTAGGSTACYFGGCTINDNITINYNNSGTLYEGYISGNIYNGNTIYNYGSTGAIYICYNQKSTFNGNLTITRTGLGNSYVFYNGFNGVSGNFSFTNTGGGPSYINHGGVLSGDIAGTLDITISGPGTPAFDMERIKNLTNGGTISVDSSGALIFTDDTLLVASISLTNIGGGADHFERNQITGNLNFSEASTNSGAVYIGANVITGNSIFSSNAGTTWYEGYTAGCTYNGNTTFNYAGSGTQFICYNQKSTFNGNLTISRTGLGITYLFYNGFNGVSGNFSLTNTGGGPSYINHGGVLSGDIAGTMDIMVSGPGTPAFDMERIKNLTNGGTISVDSSGPLIFTDDTLLVTSISLTNIAGGSDHFRRNQITGNLTFSEASDNTSAVYIGENVITGNSIFTSNAGTAWYEGYVNGCIYNGNTTFNYTADGSKYTCYNQKSTFNGNLIINRTGAGNSYVFNNGFNGVSGNFSYTNSAGGNTYINNGSVSSGAINGTINITADGPGTPVFNMNNIKNLTAGGIITVQNSGAIDFYYDTIIVNSLNLVDIGGGSDNLRYNMITGNLNFSESPANTSGVFHAGNMINGNTSYTTIASTTWYESYASSCIYNGNLTINHNGAGTFYVGYNDTTYANKNITFNSTAGIDINTAMEFGGNSDGILQQLGTQPVNIPRFIMNKTGGARLTLNSPVTVTTSLSLIDGYVYNSATNYLRLNNNINHTGAGAGSHVVGTVQKLGGLSGSAPFTFPLGTGISYNPVTKTHSATATDLFSAEYIFQNPSSNGFNTNLKAGTLTNISKAGYWNVQRLNGTFFPDLTFGFSSNPYEQYPVLANLKVAQWNSGIPQWDDAGNGGTSGTSANGDITHSVTLTDFGNFALANVLATYLYSYSNPGAGPDGTPVKIKAIGGYPPYTTKQLPGGSYSADSIYLVPNGGAASFKLKDFYNIEKEDTTITVAAAPANYISANGSGTINFVGWRHFVYMQNASNEIIGAIKDNDLTLGNTTMTAYFSTANVATAPNGSFYLKRSFKITSQFAPAGTKRVRIYISKTEYNNLVAADPASFPSGINSLTILKYTGAQEDSLFDPIPGGNSIIIPNSDITIADLGTHYSLDIDIDGFSAFYITGNQSNLNLCTGSTISIPSDVTGGTYQWQVDNGGGYTNVTNGAVYNGANTKTLTLSGIPGSMYGYKLRCFVDGSSYSQVYTLKFKASWLGAVSDVWENAANWSCGQMPDANTDVLIDTGKANYPVLNSNSTIRTLDVRPGSAVNVNTGFTLTILK